MNRLDGTIRTRLVNLAAALVASLALGVLLGLTATASPALAATLQAPLPVSDGAANDNYGTSVAISADTAVVGAPEADPSGKSAAGVAYVFVRSSGVWKLQQKLTAGDGAAGDRFGFAVAVSGDTVVIGARYSNTESIGNTGAAYVYVRSAGVWKLQQKLTAVDAAFNDDFGWSVAVSGNTVLVGARDRDTGTKADTGAAYVFVRFGTIWATQQILRVPEISAVAQDHFGESVAVSGSTALVGVPDADIVGSPNAGVAYAYTRSGVVWTAAPVLYAVGSLAAADRFGGSVSLSGNTAVIGASGHDVGANANAGAAYHFERVAGTWGAPDLWYAVDGAAGVFFGAAVSVSGTFAAIGAPHHATATVPDAGGVYRFSTSSAMPTPPLSAAVPAAGDFFGGAVAVSGDTILVGAPLRDTGGMADSGAAFVFQPAPTIYSLSPTSARRGAIVTITGTGFGRTRGASFVKFGAAKCTKYVSWSSARIRCRVPATAAFGARNVRVTLKVGTSNGMSFRVKR
jgi:hypothetical protein